jgi:hypothetical protein
LLSSGYKENVSKEIMQKGTLALEKSTISLVEVLGATALFLRFHLQIDLITMMIV